MFTSKVLALENAQVSRYFTFLTLHLPTMQTHLQQQVFNPCSRIQVVTLLNVLLQGFPRIRLRIKLWTRSLRSVVGGRYPNLHFLSLHVLAPQQREQRGQGRGTGKNKLGPTDRYVELWNFELF